MFRRIRKATHSHTSFTQFASCLQYKEKLVSTFFLASFPLRSGRIQRSVGCQRARSNVIAPQASRRCLCAPCVCQPSAICYLYLDERRSRIGREFVPGEGVPHKVEGKVGPQLLLFQPQRGYESGRCTARAHRRDTESKAGVCGVLCVDLHRYGSQSEVDKKQAQRQCSRCKQAPLSLCAGRFTYVGESSPRRHNPGRSRCPVWQMPNLNARTGAE